MPEIKKTPSFDAVQVGDELPGLAAEPITRLTLALYCGASGDHNPIHVDIDFARQAGMPDVFAHGMLSMAYLARLVTDWAPQPALRGLSTRFSAITQVGDQVRCSGRVGEKFEANGERRVRVLLEARNQAGQLKLSGEAVLALA